MTSVRVAALVVGSLVGSGVTLAARAGQDPKPITEAVTIKATIEAIDKTAKVVTLKGPRGNMVEVDASNVARFNELKVGDTVSATYSESLAVHVRKPGEPAPAAASGTVTPGAGGRPGGTAARQQAASVIVQAIDPKVPSMTIKTTDGRVLSFRVLDPKNLQGVKVGDTLDVTYTQALLMKVEPATP